MAELAQPGGGARAALGVADAAVSFQGVRAIEGVSLDLGRGEILGLIGPNGAGKTTLVNVLTGFQAPDRGRVTMEGEDITDWPAHRRSRRGLARTFQNALVFANLTVLENIESGAAAMGTDRAESRRRAWEVLDWLGLTRLAEQPAGALAFGQERRVGIGRAMAMRPHYILLDEPAAGLNTAEVDDLQQVLSAIRQRLGCGILLIEHKMSLVFGLCDRVQVLEQGRTIAVGRPAEVGADPAVRRAYLGDEAV
jgi:branched-chain amino acid transport system ATP-binding protein